jgi:NAD(P)H dehydrogenase (quinone)
MTNVLVAFYSRDGSVEALARAIGDGAMSAGGAVRLRRARELVSEEVMARVPGWLASAERMNSAYEAPTEDDAKWADAIVLGSPSRFGMIASELKAYIDSWGALWARGRLNLKVGSTFTSASTMHGGAEMTAFSLFAPMAHLGMVIVPPGYGDPAMFAAGTPYGAFSVSQGEARAKPASADLEAARYQGHRVTTVAAALAGLRVRR